MGIVSPNRYLNIGRIIGISLVLAVFLLYIGGASFDRLYFCSSTSLYYHNQVESILNGTFAIGQDIEEIQFDLAYYDGKIQQIWGLGVALWLLPFDCIPMQFGKFCPDAIPLLVLLTLMMVYAIVTGRTLFERTNSYPLSLLFPALVFFQPSLWIFLSCETKEIYDVAGIYALLFGTVLLIGSIRFLLLERNFDYFLVCILSGFIANVRPTYGAYGVVIGGVCIGTLFSGYLKKHSIRDLHKVIFGVLIILSGLLFLACTNYIRFGSAFEFGHNLTWSADVIIYLTRFENTCANESILALVPELFAWLFLIPVGVNLFAPVERWRDIYQPTFGITYLFLSLFCVVLLIEYIRNRRNGNATFANSTKYFQGNPILLTGLSLIVALSFCILAGFYLRFATISTRYIQDFSIVFLSISILLLIIPAGVKLKKITFVVLAVFVAWKALFISCAMAPKKWWKIPEIKSFALNSPDSGRSIESFEGVYSLEQSPDQTGIPANGTGWNMSDGSATYAFTVLVDTPEFIEIVTDSNPGISSPVRVKINNLELPLQEQVVTNFAENSAILRKFSIPDTVKEQNKKQLVSICFPERFINYELTNKVYQIRWQ